jgi:DNA polymerase I-like protein with 3'-5' exonuclease and polymerase domains/uracil-DNA glycosylase
MDCKMLNDNGLRRVSGYGPAQADIVIVGECPTIDDEVEGRPLTGQAGRLLGTMLREAGIDPRACYITNVCKYRPPTSKQVSNPLEHWMTDKKKLGIANEWEYKDGRYYSEEIGEGLAELRGEILDRNPRIIIGLGNTALWALAGEWGILDWRGSEMGVALSDERNCPFVPTLHPTSILCNWSTRPFTAHDLKQRVARRLRSGFVTPQWDFNYEPTLADALSFIESLAGDIAVDVETSRNRIVCVGLGVSATHAMCIPFISENYGAYWSALDAQIVIAALQQKLSSPEVKIIGQNFNYDASYFDDNFQFIPRVAFDTLIAQTVLFPGTPRGLGYLSSMYCDWHCYWKDDARDWSNLKDFDRLFRYNCRDVCATWEAAQKQRVAIERGGLMAQFSERMTYNHSVYDMMQQGVIRDETVTQKLDDEVEEALQERKIIICDAAGYPINPTSPVQVSKLLYNEWGCRKPGRKGKTPGGTGDEELRQVALWHPEYAAVLTAILEHRSLASMRSNFLRAKLDPDGKLRSSFMATGTETFRLTSSKNNFRRGTNLLNVSGSGTTHSGNKVPNFRRAIVPPVGYTIFDCDLERADLQVVVWEADDADLKAKLQAGVDIHYENAKELFGIAEPTPVQREKGKTFVHLTDYAGCARTCAIKTGSTVHEADMAQRRWFVLHPGIKTWHTRTAAQLADGRMVRNAFGYKMTFFDRVEGLLPEALAWIPQSTIAIVASLVHMNMEKIPGVTVLLQCYDSVVGIYPTAREAEILPQLYAATQVVVPYDDPLIVPMGLKTSIVSWGDCGKGEGSRKGWPK